jgi:hypothetical protein
VKPWDLNERATRTLLQADSAKNYAQNWTGFRSSNDTDVERRIQDALSHNIFHARGLGMGAAGAAAGLGAGGLMAALAPNDDDQENDNKTPRKIAEHTHMSNTPEQLVLTGTLAQKAAQVMAALNEKQAEPAAESPETAQEEAPAASADRRPAAKARAKDLLNTGSVGGFLADYLTPAHWGGTRAGRATQIAQSLGMEPSIDTRMPLRAGYLRMLTHGLGGAALGAGVGGLAGAIGGHGPDDALAGAGVGAMLGGSLGAASGPMRSAYKRRSDMINIRQKLEDELAENGGKNINPKATNFGTASSLLLPYAGAHRAGQADAYRALKDNERYRPGGRSLAYGAEFLPYVGGALTIPRGIIQNFNARGRSSESSPNQAERYGLSAAQPEGQMAPKFAAAGNWQGVDLAKNPVNWSRTLPKADASAKNWQGAQPGTPAPQVPMTGQQPAAAPAAAPPMAPVNQAPPMVPVGAKSAASEAQPASQEHQRLFAIGAKNDPFGHADKARAEFKKRVEADEKNKSASLRNFGAKVAGFNIGDLTKHLPAAGVGALGGAAVGGLAGMINPGHDDVYDDNGRVVGRQQRSRFGAALRGALGGGAAGGLAGGAMSAFAPKATAQAGQWLQNQGQNMRQMYNRNTPVPTAAVQQARQTREAEGLEPGTDPLLGDSPSMVAARRA